MVAIHCAYTEQINPAGRALVISREQVWKGLQRKIRKAQDFVPVIVGTDVVEDHGDTVVRVAHFKNFHGKPEHSVREVCKSYYPTRVDFWQPNGAVITNTISDGSSLEENDLNMTYTFEWRYENVADGSDEHKKLSEEHRQGAKTAVHSSIEALCRMASAGELD